MPLARRCWMVWLLFAAAPLWAQVPAALTPGTEAPQPAATPPALQAVDADAIISRADTDERLALSAIERASAAHPSVALAPGLEVIARSVDARLQQFTPAQLRMLPIMRLESLDRHWRFDARRFARWREAMKLATAPYASDVAAVAQRRAAWQLTRAQAGNLPPVLVARIDAVIDLLARAEQALAVPLGHQVELGTRANALESRLDEGQEAVSAAIGYIDRRLLRLDVPPLWRASSRADAAAGAGATDIATGLRIETEFAAAYSEANFSNQVATHVLQLLLLPLMLWLWRRSRPAIAAGEMDASAARVLSRPWSTWLLLCMLATLAFEPDAPVLTRHIAMLIALVPVLRLLPPGARRWLDVWPYVATGMYLLSGLGFVFLGSGFAFRLYTLFVSCVGLAATGWLLWRAKRHADSTGAVGRALRGAGWMGLLLLAVAVVANVVGNTSLSEMLTGAVIDSAYLGLLLYVGVTAVVTLLHLLLNRPGLRRFRLTREHAPPLVQLLTRLAIIAAAVGWVLYSMESFRILRPIYRLLKDVLGHEFTIGDFSLSLGHVLVFVLAILIASWASRVTRLLLQDVLESRGIFARGVGNSIASLASYAVLVLGIVVALSAAGLKGTQLALVFGALGVGIGFGLQNVVNNFVSGLILIFERPIQPGDAIEVGTTQGRVRDIGMRATRIRTFDGADVVVPNGTLLSERLTNWTLMDRSRRLEIKLGVAYGSDPKKVMALLTDCAAHTAGIASAPAVTALFDGFGASSLDFTLRAWTHDYDNWTVIRSDLVTRIHAALAQAGIEIPFPQQDVRVRSWPQGGAAQAPPGDGTPA